MKTSTRNSSASSEHAAGRARVPKVLVVDDERLVADTLSLIFQHAGFVTYTAYSASEALRLGSQHAPDMLVSDVDMPGTGGVDLALSLLENKPDCEVILFSGHASISDLARAQAAGYEFPLLPKPVHPQVLLESVSKMLGVEIPADLPAAHPVPSEVPHIWNA